MSLDPSSKLCIYNLKRFTDTMVTTCLDCLLMGLLVLKAMKTESLSQASPAGC